MELNKIHEAYTLIDNTDNWMTSGNVTKSEIGEITINITTTLKSITSESNQWGSMHYQNHEDNRVTTSFNFEGTYKAEYVDYCEQLVSQILEQL